MTRASRPGTVWGSRRATSARVPSAAAAAIAAWPADMSVWALMDTGGDPPATPPAPPADPLARRTEPRMPRPGNGATSPRSTTVTSAGSAPRASAIIVARRSVPSSEAPAIHRRASVHAAVSLAGVDPAAQTVDTKARTTRSAVDVACAFPDSISDAVSVTYRPSTRAMAMRHSRRARETGESSLFESVAAEVLTAGSSAPGPPGVAMVSPPPPRRARKPDTGGVGGVDDVFVDDIGALFEPAGAPSRRSIIPAAASSSKFDGSWGDSGPAPEVSGAGVHHTASAHAACAANHIVFAPCSSPPRTPSPTPPAPSTGPAESFESCSPLKAEAARVKNPRSLASSDARDRARNGSAAASRPSARIAEARGSRSPSSHASNDASRVEDDD